MYLKAHNPISFMSTGVAVLIYDESDVEPAYLMLEQDRDKYDTGVHYAPPAGTFDAELDDTTQETAVREIQEETGLDIREDDLEMLFETDASYGVEKLVWYRLGTNLSDQEIELNHEADGYTFLTREEAREEELLEDTRKAFNML